MTPFSRIGDAVVTDAVVRVPSRGPWYAEVTLADEVALSGRVTLSVGTLALVGTVDASHVGTHGLSTRARIVGGGGGWGRTIGAKGYHADNGVRALVVAQDAAREAGETLGSFVPAAESVGVDCVRRVGPASVALEAAAGSACWWVGYDGATAVGRRAERSTPSGAYVLEAYDPREGTATLALDDLDAVGVGSRLAEGLDRPRTVDELEIVVTSDTCRMRVRLTDGERAGLASTIESIVERILSRRAYGLYRYRAVRMSVDRVELQVVDRRDGLPDILPVSMWPGVAGAHADLALGAEVLVAFVAGSVAQPVIVGFAGRGGPGATPVRLILDADTIDLVAGSTAFVARADKVDAELSKIAAAFSAHVHMGVTAGAANSGTAVIIPKPPYSAGSTAAAKVRVT